MDNARKVAVDILNNVLGKNAFSNIELGKQLNKSKLNEKDKGLVTEIVYGTIKYKYTIDIILASFLKNGIDSLDSFILNLLRMTVYQIKYLDKIPDFAAVDEAVNISKKYRSIGSSKLVNGVLRNYIRSLAKQPAEISNNISKLSYDYSFEPWMVNLLIDQYGEKDAISILEGLNKIPNVTIRVNNLKIKFDEAFQKLCDLGYNVEEGNVCAEAIRIEKGKNIENNPLFRDGFITVQDESAMLVAPSLDLMEDMLVLDMCSAPGGKTTHISELMDNTGTVKAFDIYNHKLKLVEDNAKRLGVTNISCEILDATTYSDSLRNSADRILIDVPCSGIGIIRKKPEIKWSKSLKDLSTLIDIQRKIISNAVKYLKPGGIMIYSTCTLNKHENEENIEWLTKQFPAISVEPLYYGKLDNLIYHEKGYVTILPNEYMDGFFIAKLKRQC